MDKKQLQEFMTAIGTVAETALIFYRSVLEAGGTPEEAMRLTQALIASLIFGGGKKDTPPPPMINRKEQNEHARQHKTRKEDRHSRCPERAALHRAA